MSEPLAPAVPVARTRPTSISDRLPAPPAAGHRTAAELEAALDHIRAAPADHGVVELVVSRPGLDQRLVLDVATLTRAEGLVGDTWSTRASRHTPDGSPHPGKQLTFASARVTRPARRHRRPHAARRRPLHVDLDLSEAALPPGTRLSVGTAVVEITAEPHTGCAKFVDRFGRDAMRFVNSPVGRELRLPRRERQGGPRRGRPARGRRRGI